MKKILMLSALLLVAASPAFACSCAPDADGSAAARVLADPANSVADVTVRGYNTHNGQSMLQIDNVRHGGLTARDIRAKFTNSAACGVVPNQKKMTLIIHNDSDGRYSIGNLCDTMAVKKKLGL